METGDSWHLAKACKFLRKDKKADSVIKITKEFSSRDIISPKADTAVFTSRAGAFKDLFRFREAKIAAHEAIALSDLFLLHKSDYPYNVLGAIAYAEGDYDTGSEYFSEAIRLGASRKSVDNEIRKIINQSNPKTVNDIVDYLLNKDGERYAWAEKFRVISK